MGYTTIKPLPPVRNLIANAPLLPEHREQVLQHRLAIQRILENRDQRLILIVGPCSAWPIDATLAYARRLADLQSHVEHAVQLVMRVYVQKPRTTTGWTGLLSEPDPFGPPDLETGIRQARQLMLDIIAMGLPIADEAVFTHHAALFTELLSWIAIGARSTENPAHRIFASAMDLPVGMKNPTHGHLLTAVNSVVAAQNPHVTVWEGQVIQTHGNPHAHVVLRGSQQKPNYTRPDLLLLKNQLEQKAIRNPAVLIDASHDNCWVNGQKNPKRQTEVIFEVLQSSRDDTRLKDLIKGFMVESFLKEGCQVIDPRNPNPLDRKGLSITDPCLGWDDTERLIHQLAEWQR